ARSFVKYQNLKPSANTLPRLLVQNNITGCTLMGNRALFNACRTATPEDTASILMHDWWLGLIAAAFGRVAFLPVQAMQYRQHGGNQVGAKSARDVAYIRRQIHEKLKNKGKYTTTCAQAAAFANAFAAALTPAQKEMLQAYIALPNQPKIRRWRTVFRYSFWMQGLSRKIAQLLFG
ncbi:MAG: hypothetical protein FWF49_05080, partial [Oscillospiraceae bacterium]|nr:hypothetical protein [Oscillospiraceae bacterium]